MDESQIQKEIEGKEETKTVEGIKKEDWENAQRQFGAMVINSKLNLEAQEFMLKRCVEELNKFPEEEIPEDIKSIVKATQ